MAREEAGEKGLDVQEGTSDGGGGALACWNGISSRPLGWVSGLCAAGQGLQGRQASEGRPWGLSGLGTA